MNIFMTGGSGLIGSSLIEALSSQHQIFALTNQSKINHPNIRTFNHISLCPATHIDTVIHLAGASIIDERWSKKRKKIIIDSRVSSTEMIGKWMRALSRPPKLFISFSAAGYYGDQDDQFVDEQTKPNPSFLHSICQAWEESAQAACLPETRLVTLRLGNVLSNQGGFLPKVQQACKVGITKMGTGQQWVSWIHIQDLIKLINAILVDDRYSGTFNACSPGALSNAELHKVISEINDYSQYIGMSKWLLQMLLGERSTLLLHSQRMTPARLLDRHFRFKYIAIASSIINLTC